MKECSEIKLTFSLIIPTLNRPNQLKETLDSIMKQSLLPQAVYVIDQSDTTDTKELCAAYDLIRYVHSDIKSLTHARNIGIKLSEETNIDIICFSDDDIVLYDDYFLNMMRCYRRHPDAAGVTGSVLSNSRPYSGLKNIVYMLSGFDYYTSAMKFTPNFCATAFKKIPTDDTRVEWMPGVATSFRNRLKLGQKNEYFDEKLIMYAHAEDRDFSYRLSKRGDLFYAPDVKLWHMATPEGRISNRKLTFMKCVHHYYLMRKHFDATLLSNVLYWWCSFMRLVFALRIGFLGSLSHDKARSQYLKDTIDACLFVYNNKSKIASGDLSEIHSLLKNRCNT